MKIGLRQLKHVLAVAQLRNFTRAAEQQGISQSALSRSIANMEVQFGVRLFERDRGGVVLTPACVALVADAESLLLQAELLENNLARQGTTAGRPVNLGLGRMAASILLPGLIGALTRASPHRAVLTVLGTASVLAPAVESGGLDCAFLLTHSLPDMPGLLTRHVGEATVELYARAGHPLAGKANLTKDDLQQFPVMATTSILHWSDKKFGSLPFPSIICGDFGIAKEAVLQSDALLAYPSPPMAHDVAGKRVVKLDYQAGEGEWLLSISMMWRPSHADQDLVDSIRDTAEQVLAQGRRISPLP